MHYNKSKEIKVGVVTFVAILLFIVGMTLGKGYRFSVDSTELSIRFPNSGGIGPSAPVLINGVERGNVNTIDPDNGSVLITITLDNINDLHSDASARISMLEITGGKKIDLFPGKAPGKLDPKKTISGKTSPDLGELISVTGELIIEKGVPLFLKIDSLLTKLSNDTIIAKIIASIDNTHQITESARNLISGREKDLNETISNLKDISIALKYEINDKSPKVDSLIVELDKVLKSTNRLILNADSSAAKVDVLLKNFNSLIDDAKNSDGLIAKLLYDKEFAAEFDSTLVTIKLLIQQIKEHGINTNVRLGSRP